MRLDVFLVEKGFFSSREMAKFNIAKGNVTVNGKAARKPSQPVTGDDCVELVEENVIPYVSRGGLKLERALEFFNIDCSGLNVLDVGASTGGFTHCVLKHGAGYVCAVDVGSNQLDFTLRMHKNVKSLENTNIKELDLDAAGGMPFDLLVADLSFISLTKVLEFLPKFLKSQGRAITLIKPQFEVGQSQLSKAGIVSNPKAHVMAIEKVVQHAAAVGLHLIGLTYSPIHHDTGNIEYLALWGNEFHAPSNIKAVVDGAFALKKQFY